MRNRAYFALVSLLLLLVAHCQGVQAQPQTHAVSHGTQLLIKNGTTTNPLYVVIKFPSSSTFGCGPLSASGLKVVTHAAHQPATAIPVNSISGAPGLAYFTLTANQTAAVSPATGFSCLQGLLFTFGAQGQFPQCPCGPSLGNGFNSLCSDVAFPFGDPNLTLANGTNSVEVTINVSPNQETTDISCNQGANSIVNVALSSSNWTNGIKSITNSTVDIATQVDNNCSINGVFPYNLDNCNSGPISCSGGTAGPFCTTSFPTVCQVQRAASGGTVTITYKGTASP